MNWWTRNIGLNDEQTMRRTIVKMASRIDILEERLAEGEDAMERSQKLITNLLEITDTLKDKIRRLEGGE